MSILLDVESISLLVDLRYNDPNTIGDELFGLVSRNEKISFFYVRALEDSVRLELIATEFH